MNKKGILCKLFGHGKFRLSGNWDNIFEFWLSCGRCGCEHTEDVPRERLQEAEMRTRLGLYGEWKK